MSLLEWTTVHLLGVLFWLWILNWGGARWLEGWRAFFLLDWFAARWNAEQLRLYALLLLVLQSGWFVLGAIVPAYRGLP